MTYHLEYVYSHNREELRNLIENCNPEKKKLSSEIINNAIILAPPAKTSWGGVLRNDGSFVENSGVYKDVGGNPEIQLVQNMLKLDGTYIYIGWFHNGWGHSFTDYIKKIWFIHTPEGKRLIKEGARFLYICSGNSMPHKNIIFILSHFGVNLHEHTMIRQHTCVERLIVPDDCLSGGVVGDKHYTMEYVYQLKAMKNRIHFLQVGGDFPIYEKIYFSRSNVQWHPRRDYCEIGIEKAFKKMGYTIICPEKLPVHEQLFLLYHCKTFAATEGSVSHNAIFCRPGTKVIIVKKSDYVNRYQLILDKIADVDVTYIDAHKTPTLWEGSEWYGPFFMHVSRELQLYAGKTLWLIYRPFWSYYLWWYKAYGNRRTFKKIESWLDYIGIHINPYYNKN